MHVGYMPTLRSRLVKLCTSDGANLPGTFQRDYTMTINLVYGYCYTTRAFTSSVEFMNTILLM